MKTVVQYEKQCSVPNQQWFCAACNELMSCIAHGLSDRYQSWVIYSPFSLYQDSVQTSSSHDAVKKGFSECCVWQFDKAYALHLSYSSCFAVGESNYICIYSLTYCTWLECLKYTNVEFVSTGQGRAGHWEIWDNSRTAGPDRSGPAHIISKMNF